MNNRTESDTPHDQRLHGCLRRVLEAWTIVDRSAQPPRAGRVAVDRAAFEGLQAAVQVWRCATILYAAAESWDVPIAPPELDIDDETWAPYDRTPLIGDATDGLVDSLTLAAVTAAADLGSHVATIAATSTTTTKAWLPGDAVARARRLTAAWRRASVELLDHEDDEHPTAPPAAFPVEAEPEMEAPTTDDQASTRMHSPDHGTMCGAFPPSEPMVYCELPAGHEGPHLGITYAGSRNIGRGAWSEGEARTSPLDEEDEGRWNWRDAALVAPETATPETDGAATEAGDAPPDDAAPEGDDQAPDDETLPPEAGDVDGGAA